MMKDAIDVDTPDAYLAALSGWRGAYVQALRSAVLEAAPSLVESLKWGHLVYHADGPALLIRAEARRVLFGFWRGQQLRHLEPRLKPGGKYLMATLVLVSGTPLERGTVLALAREAVSLNARLGNPAVANVKAAGR